MPTLKSTYRNFGSILRADGFITRKHRGFGTRVINKTGTAIGADKLVAISGFDTTAKLPKVVLADADAAAHRDIYVTLQSIPDLKEGNVFKGALSAADLDTSAVAAVGDPVYLSTTAGAFTATAPTALNARVQLVGYALVDSATVGQIQWDIPPIEKLGAAEVNGFGYTSGGTVTQATSKATGVTLDQKTGEITMNAASLAADTTVAFTLTNSFIALGDYVLIQHVSAGTQAAYIVTASAAAGSATVNVHNATAAALAEAIVLKFVLIKSATA